MKKRYFVLTILIISTVIALCSFSACASKPDNIPTIPGDDFGDSNPDWSDDSVNNPKTVRENPVIDTKNQTDLYFSVDTHTAGYTQLKNTILSNKYYGSYANMVKIDQMLNYFNYDYTMPQGDDLLAINASMFDCPYNANKKLLRVGLTSKLVELESMQNNIVLLLDVSGSMIGAVKIDLMKSAMIQMVENLNPSDTVSIVTYSEKTKVIIDGMTIGENINEIKRKINDLRADGGTNGEGGIQKAYEVAKSHYIEGGNNRIILATDGDFNIGISDEGELKEFISAKRNDGIYLTCIGLGNNYDYSVKTMEALAKSGNGYWGYIHNMDDAQKLLVDDLSSTIITIAKDVKAKILFNADIVDNFRLLGYEGNVISGDDYEDHTTDAGEIGTGFTLSLCFEIQLHESADISQPTNIATVNIRYKDAEATANDPSKELNLNISSDCYTDTPSQDDVFASSVVEFALVLLNSKYKADANLNNVIERLQNLNSDDKYKKEFLQLVTTYTSNLNNTNLRIG